MKQTDDSIWSQVEGFEWDEGNIEKNKIKHHVDQKECEQIFFNEPLLIGEDTAHSTSEKRKYALGKTNKDRLLFIAFTLRGNKIRIISARPQNRKEQKKYKLSTINEKI